MYLVARSQNFNTHFAYFCITDMHSISSFVINMLRLPSNYAQPPKNTADDDAVSGPPPNQFVKTGF